MLNNAHVDPYFATMFYSWENRREKRFGDFARDSNFWVIMFVLVQWAFVYYKIKESYWAV